MKITRKRRHKIRLGDHGGGAEDGTAAVRLVRAALGGMLIADTSEPWTIAQRIVDRNNPQQTAAILSEVAFVAAVFAAAIPEDERERIFAGDLPESIRGVL